MESKITVVLCEPGKRAQVVEIENTLEAMQRTVGGLIEAIYTDHDYVCLIVNEDGKLLDLPMNRAIYVGDTIADIIMGSFFVAAFDDDGNFMSLNDDQIKRYEKQYRWPEKFTFLGNRIISEEVHVNA